MQNSADILLALIGAFYAFAGIVGVRAAASSRILDTAIERITLTPTDARERWRAASLLAMSSLVFLGGLALLARLDAARWLFVAASLAQAVYIWWLAPRHLDDAEGPDATGRQRTVNAFAVHLAASALVLWLGSGRLATLEAAPAWSLALAGLGTAAFVGYSVKLAVAARGIARS